MQWDIDLICKHGDVIVWEPVQYYREVTGEFPSQ